MPSGENQRVGGDLGPKFIDKLDAVKGAYAMRYIPQLTKYPTMFFYHTILDCATGLAEPWIERLIGLLTSQVQEQNQILSARLSLLEDTRIHEKDVCVVDTQEHSHRLTRVEEALQHQEHRADEIEAAYHRNAALVQNSIDDIHQVKSYVMALEQATCATDGHIHALTKRQDGFESGLKTLSESIADKESRLALRQDSLSSKNGDMNETINRLASRLEEMESRLTGLQTNIEAEKLERVNSKLKKKHHFLSR